MDKKYIIIGILLILIIVLIIISLLFKEKNDLNIYFFNAGKADCSLIYKGDIAILIDTGEKDLYDSISKYLDSHNIKKIDYLILSHFDKDHIGSASKIINNYEIGEILQSNSPKDSSVYKEYIETINNKNIKNSIISNDKEFVINKDLKLIVNGPEIIYNSDPSNNSSLIVTIYYKDKSFLFTGDAKSQRLKDYMSNHNESYDLIKVPYHGRSIDNLEEFISIVKPKYSIITNDDQNIESIDTYTILKKYNSEVFITRDGNVLVSIKDSNMSVRYV